VLPCQVQRRAARHQELQARTRREQTGQVCRRRQHLLEVVEHQQQLSIAQLARQPLRDGLRSAATTDAQFARDGRGDEQRVANRRQIDEHDAVGEAVLDGPRQLDRQARFADPAGAGQGEQADLFVEQPLGGLSERVFPPDQRRRLFLHQPARTL